MTATAEDLRQTRQVSHKIVTFGIADAVPLSAFDEAGLDITKFNALSFAKDHRTHQHKHHRIQTPRKTSMKRP